MRRVLTNSTASPLAAGVVRFTIPWGNGNLVVTMGATTTVTLYIWEDNTSTWVAVGAGITATGIIAITGPGLYSVGVVYSAGAAAVNATAYAGDISA